MTATKNNCHNVWKNDQIMHYLSKNLDNNELLQMRKLTRTSKAIFNEVLSERIKDMNFEVPEYNNPYSSDRVQSRTATVVVLGDVAVGKTALIKCLINDESQSEMQ